MGRTFCFTWISGLKPAFMALTTPASPTTPFMFHNPFKQSMPLCGSSS